jgi:hypothetical protein
MYAANPTVAALWRELLVGVMQRAGISAQWIDHAAPALR